jgi:hypothetical protein
MYIQAEYAWPEMCKVLSKTLELFDGQSQSLDLGLDSA